MSWIDNKKAYDMVLQTWIIECLKMYKIFEQLITYIVKAMKNWKVELTTGGKTISEGIFQGDSLTP